MGELNYWRLVQADRPGDVIAEHDGFQGLPGAGPGRYRVEVRRPGPWANRTTIELTEEGTSFAFNRGQARWFGLRLIEAAAIDELREANSEGAQASVRWSEIQDWMHQNAADYLADVRPGDSIIPSVLKLLGDAKEILAETVFLDCETTGLQWTDDVWEFAGIRRDPDGSESQLHLFIEHSRFRARISHTTICYRR